jgi:hypothetical protein
LDSNIGSFIFIDKIFAAGWCSHAMAYYVSILVPWIPGYCGGEEY